MKIAPLYDDANPYLITSSSDNIEPYNTLIKLDGVQQGDNVIVGVIPSAFINCIGDQATLDQEMLEMCMDMNKRPSLTSQCCV